MPLPPLNEQRRIVAKIEALQARSDAAKEALDAIPPLLEQFRQSVLAAAFRGDLTKQWREQNPDVEPASVLLDRIRVERKARFIDDAAEKARAKAEANARAAGKPWTRADQAAVVDKARAKAEAKYEEPAPVDAAGLPELPAGWCWTSVDNLVRVGTGATPKRGEDKYWRDGTIAWVTSGSVNHDRVDMAHEYVTDVALEETNLSVYPAGTILMAMYGEGKTRGHCTVLGISATVNQALAALVSESQENVTPILRLFLDYNYEATRGAASGGVQPNLNLSIVKSIRVPLPPKLEQSIIVDVITKHFAALKELKTVGAAQRSCFDQLNQSILAKAFRGELVPQDPSDEPASVLLERIRAERAAAPSARRTSPRAAPPAPKPTPKPAPRAAAQPEPRPAPSPAAEEAAAAIVGDAADEANLAMAVIRLTMRGRAAVPRDELVRAIASAFGYQRVRASLRERIDGHLRAAERRHVLEAGGRDELRLSTVRLDQYHCDALVATLGAVSRSGCVYERDELARLVIAHLGFKRLTKAANDVIKSAFNASIRRRLFERVDATRLRRLASAHALR